jgi:PhzF family phenazine biosynthesis protein
MPVQVALVDAFSQGAFGGNRAGVCLLESWEWPDDGWMRSVAGELHAETAFVCPPRDAGSGKLGLRWFTATSESNVCGHATLATAHVLHGEQPGVGAFRFDTSYGQLDAFPRNDGSITLDFPASPIVSVPPLEDLAEALQVERLATFRTGRLGDLLVVLGDENAVRRLQPRSSHLVALCRRDAIRGIIATAEREGSGGGYDFVSRYFAPANGLEEDQVTGSAHTALAPYWSQRLARERLTGLQVSARAGIVKTQVQGNRVYLTGYAVTTVRGTLLIAAHDSRQADNGRAGGESC